MAEVDLHLHTTFSDGRLTPTELVELCAKRGLKVISISDHDSTEALTEAFTAADAFPELTIIPGIELSTDVPGSEIHVLGYFVDREDVRFQATLGTFREGRQARGREMVERLNKLGIDISWQRVTELSDGGAIGRPHIAEAMVEAGYVEYPRDAFDQYLGRGGKAYVERLKLTPVEAVKILTENGALPVMAHPTYAVSESSGNKTEELKATLKDLRAVGLVGMEVYYGDYSAEQVEWLAGIARDLALVPCGGSDYHASGNPGEPEPGTVGPPFETVEALRALKEERTSTAHG